MLYIGLESFLQTPFALHVSAKATALSTTLLLLLVTTMKMG